MTAIAGCFGLPAQNLAASCSAMLHAQRQYGANPPVIRSYEGSSFGLSLWPQLPEDCFDRQPLLDDLRFHLVADVRLDNRDDLARALGIARPEAAKLCDADLLLQAWKKWQDASLNNIIGDFAIAVFDRVERKLTLARDHSGQRPLFFTRNDRIAAFASMPSGLLAIKPASLRLEPLAAIVQGHQDPDETTYFEGICRVLPGHIAVLTPHSAVQRPYWTPAFDPLRLRKDEYADCYREALEAAVTARMRRNAGPLGVQLSSGYDSSAVAGTAAHLEQNERLIAFTAAPRMGFDGPVPRGRMADESAIAAETARLHGMRHIVVRPANGILTPLREHARLYQHPDRNIVNIEWWNAILGAAKHQGANVILTGQLGNLTLNAGGLPVLAEWVRQGRFFEWWCQARAAKKAQDVRWRGILIASFGDWLPAFVANPIDRFFGHEPASPDGFVRAEWLKSIREQADGQPDSVCPGPYFGRRSWLAKQDGGLFRKGALAASGVDERDPTADRRLIDFSFRLPPEQLLNNGISRPLARAALADRLPDAVLNSRLRGYQGADWYERFDKAEARALVEELEPSTTVNALMDLTKIKAAIDQWPTSGWGQPKIKYLYRTRLLSALSTGAFIQEFESPSQTAASCGTSARGTNRAP